MRVTQKICFRRSQSRYWPWLALLFAVAFARSTFAANFTATLDRDTITLGESAALTLTFEGGQPSSISQPDVPGLQFADRGSSQNISFVNGAMSATIAETFEVTAKQPGEFTIPAFKVQIGGQNFTSQPLTLKVLKPGAPPAAAIANGSQLAFLKLVAPKQDVYVGETFTLEVDLYLRGGLQNAGNFQFTSLPTDGFTAGKWVQGQNRQVQIGNATYRLVPLSIALTAIKTGTFTLGPITASIVVELPSQNRRRGGDPFFDQFDSMFNRGEQKQLTLATEEQQMTLLPLPKENVPPSFSGAVGNFTMTATAGPTNVAAGDPITVRVQINGRGALDSLSLPEQTDWKDFKVYPPTSKVSYADQLGIQGTKAFEEIVVPQNSDIKALPPIAFSFFNPDSKKYETLTEPTVPLTVRPGGSATVPLAANAARPAPDSQATARDIIPIKQRLGEVAQISPPLIQQPWFLALQGVPLFAFLGALVWRKRGESLANNPRQRRQRQVTQIVREGLGELKKSAAANDSEAFFATVFRLLQEQLGERLDVPSSAITESVIEEHLRPRRVPEEILAQLHELFQTCNLARYAPIKSSGELAALIPKVERALRETREIKL